MKKMKFLRVMRRLFRVFLFLAAVVSSSSLLTIMHDREREKAIREKRYHLISTVLVCITTTAVSVAAFCVSIAAIRRRRGGYLFDLFDRDEYDLVSPDEEDEYSDIINGELNPDDEGITVRRMNRVHIPLDDETTEENI